MSETPGERPVEETLRPLYSDSQVVQWAVDVLKDHGHDKRPDMIWRLEQMAQRLRAQAISAYQQPAEPRFTLEEILAKVSAIPVQGGLDETVPDDKEEAYRKGYEDALRDVSGELPRLLQESRR